jgi:preprotein translocase subunit SecG
VYNFILLLHVLFCLAIIALVLLQQGKGADVGAAFGSGSANSVFGSRGPASFLFKLTIFFAALFFISSIALTMIQKQNIIAANQLAAPTAPVNTSSQPGTAGFVPPAATLPHTGAAGGS